MPFKHFLANIRRYTNLTPLEEDALTSLLSIKRLNKKEFLLRKGNICEHEYYVNTGCLRSYFTDEKGLEHNLYFAIEDWWVSDLYSRTRQQPTHCDIVALEDAELVQISHADLEAFIGKTPAMEKFFRISYQQSLVNQHLRNLQMLYMNGEERYIQFRKNYPQLAERIPQKHIATFLGLTPQFFNTIHVKVLREE